MAPELPWVLEVEPLGMEPVLAWVATELLRSPPLPLETPQLVQRLEGVAEAESERPEPSEEPGLVQPGEVGGVEALDP